jgi:hypothetical protein
VKVLTWVFEKSISAEHLLHKAFPSVTEFAATSIRQQIFSLKISKPHQISSLPVKRGAFRMHIPQTMGLPLTPLKLTIITPFISTVTLISRT